MGTGVPRSDGVSPSHPGASDEQDAEQQERRPGVDLPAG